MGATQIFIRHGLCHVYFSLRNQGAESLEMAAKR